MQLSKIKKPWFVPAWVWNKGIDLAAEKAKEEAKIDAIASMAGDRAADLMEKVVADKDPSKVANACANCKRAADLFGCMSAALMDSQVSAEERRSIAGALADVIGGFISRAAIDAKIDEIAEAVKA